MSARPASAKPKRQYGHIKESLKKQGKSDALAEQLAAQTVDRSPRGEGDAAPDSDDTGQRPPAGGHEQSRPRKP